MKKLISFILITMMIIQGCNYPSKKVDEQSNSSPKNQDSAQKKISFEIGPLDLSYDKGSGLVMEKYLGTAIITAVGDESLVKKPYLVLVQTNKISGGDKSNNNNVENIIVYNGIGKIKTLDWNTDRENTNFAKPVYEFKLIGYIPYNEVETSKIEHK